jgi:hypothetical protein
MMKRFRLEQRQNGAVALMVALLLIVLIAVAGLVVDLGRLFVVKTELQNAVDACALAAARELNVPSKTLAVLTRAENAGIEVGNRHFDDFQHDQVVLQTDHDVTFSTALDGAYVTKASAGGDVRYVRCTHQVTGLIPTLMSILGVGNNSVAATAVATLQGGMTSCPIPLAMCKQNAPVPPCTVPNTTPDRFGLCVGQWYAGLLDPKDDQFAGGNFNWIDFTPHAGGRPEISEAVAGEGFCDIDSTMMAVHAEPGKKVAVKDAWNSRFGLYPKNGKLDVESAPPDFTGYAYGPGNWSQAQLAYADYRNRQVTFEPYPGDNVTELSTKNNYTVSTRDDHRLGTSDRRIVSMPLVACPWPKGHQAPVEGWVCALMVHTMPAKSKDDPKFDEVRLEYLGEVTAEGSPCASFGQPSGPGGTGPKVPTLVQ